MSSEYSTVIKLDPFLQRFLMAQHSQADYARNGKIFVFPLRDDFAILLCSLVSPVPCDYVVPDYGGWTFRVKLPFMDHKNVEVYNYMSKRSCVTFGNHVRRNLNVLFHSELSDVVYKKHFTRTEAIDYLADQFGFLPDDYDRLLKEYQRWIKNEQVKRYRKRKKKKEKCLKTTK